MRVREDSPADVSGLSRWPPAAGGGGAQRRIAARGAGSGARGAAHRVQAQAGGGRIGASTSRRRGLSPGAAEQRREQLVALFEEVKGCTKCPLHETRGKAVFG